MVATELVGLSEDRPVDVGASTALCVGTPYIMVDVDRKGCGGSEGCLVGVHGELASNPDNSDSRR